jgi:hypothetical protein
MFGLLAVVLAGVGLFLMLTNRPSSPPTSTSIVGVYLLTGNMPEGSRMRMEIRPDKHWVMSNMLTGYWGTWKESGDGYDLICTDGPAGRLPNLQSQPASLEEGGAKLRLGDKAGTMTFDRTTGDFKLPASPENKP